MYNITPTQTSSTGYVPLLVWNRLESRPRKADFDEALRTEIHDPLWMLARQWQFGEYDHDDTGTPVSVKIALESSKMTRFIAEGSDVNSAKNYVEDIPMEAEVEHEFITLSLQEQAKIGAQWLKMLNKRGAGVSGYTTDLYKDIFIQTYPFDLPTLDVANEPDTLLKARLHSDVRSKRLLTSYLNRQVNGKTLYEDIVAGTTISTIDVSIQSGHQSFIDQAAADFQNWVEALFIAGDISSNPQPDNTDAQTWKREQLEYHFSVASPNHPDGTAHTAYKVDNYHGGRLDWYAFDIDENAPDPDLENYDLNTHPTQPSLTEKNLSLLPSQARFAGMPSSRWWEFEDGSINFGKLDANVTDAAKWLLAQFALVYQDDWFVLPYQIPIGTISEVKAIRVTDTFGLKTMVLPSGSYEYQSGTGFTRTEDEDWNRWSMFNLNVSGASPGQKSDPRLLLAPATAKVQSGDPLEKVVFVRDEMSNNVWAIEKIVQDYMGQPVDGGINTQEYRDYLESLKPGPEAVPSTTEPDIYYRIGREIPENWIPFLPVHDDTVTNRTVKLQRGSLLRTLSGYDTPITRIRPQTKLLRPGIEDDNTQPVNLPSVDGRMFVHEEEIPRAGIILERMYNRTRWYNGKTVLWMARRKVTGKGEGNSGLTFDNIDTLS